MLPATCARTLLLLLTALLLQACSALRFAYDQADTLLYWRLDSYLDFTSEQAPRVREGLAQFMAWHRRSQLPRYAEELQRLRPLLAGEISAERACGLAEQLRAVVEPPLLEPDNWPLLWLAEDLGPAQLRHLERKQQTEDERWRADWLDGTPEQRRERRFERLLDRAERLYGDLGEAQQAALREALDRASSFDPARSFAERQRRQQELLQLLRQIQQQKPGPAAVTALLRGHLERSLRQLEDPVRQRYAQALLREGCQVFARLHQSSTPAQRERAQRTLKRWEDDFRQLAAARG
jgi:hypothetical protein